MEHGHDARTRAWHSTYRPPRPICFPQIRLLASFRHPRIVRLHETFLDGGGDARRPLHLCVVMEYCGFQDLERKIRRYRARGEHVDERVVWVYLVQTLEALQALHSLKILHRGACVYDTCGRPQHQNRIVTTP